MQLRSILLAFSTILFFLTTSAQITPLSANEVMQEAMQRAAKEKKNIIIIFHASWCGWCHKMDSSLNDKTCKNFFDDNYVIRHLTVDESKDKKDLENPGANEFRSKYHGDEVGIPFWLIFDKDGNLLADSKIRPDGAGFDTKGSNIGCPASVDEVTAFIKVLKKISPITAAEEAAIEKRFRQNDNE